MRLKDKVALITGAGSGIGERTAILFAAEGARVAVADYDFSKAEKTVATIKGDGGEAVSIQADVARGEDVKRMVADTVKSYGRLDILFNNAGISHVGAVVDTEEEDWDRVLGINLKGIYLGSKYAIPEMIKGGGGSIINMSSIAGLAALVERAAYCASKGGVISLTKSIAIDYIDQNIRVNCLCPGTVDTPLARGIIERQPDPEAEIESMMARQAMGRFATAEEIAFAALYLASDESSYVTGSPLIIDGGATAR